MITCEELEEAFRMVGRLRSVSSRSSVPASSPRLFAASTAFRSSEGMAAWIVVMSLA